MPLVAELQAVSRFYGAIGALREVDFQVPEGGVHGVIGANGAGKTTLLKILQGFEAPDAGRATVLGRDAGALGRSERGQLGAQLDTGGLPRNLRCLELLRFLRRLYADRGRPLGCGLARGSESLLGAVGLEGAATQLVRDLSTGQHRRLAVACALVGEPRVAFLDEPSLGLDPVGKRALWELLLAAAARGTTLLVTTNAMDEAETLCDHVVFLQEGRMVASGSPGSLVDRYAPEHRIRFEGQGDPALLRRLAGLPGVAEVRVEPPGAVLLTRDAMATLRALTAPQAAPVPPFQWAAPRLEDVFHHFEREGG